MDKTAYFVVRPRTITDLYKPHLVGIEQPYQIVYTVVLSKMDYENFSTDLLADRSFLDELETVCYTGTILRCILVQQRGKQNGILVIPKNGFVELAAYMAADDFK